MQSSTLLRFLFLAIFLSFSKHCFSQCVLPFDCDGDLIADSIDLDDDNDGILDQNEIECSFFISLTEQINTNLLSGTENNLWPFQGNSVTLNYSLNGINPGTQPAWAGGVTTQNNGGLFPDGDYLNLQPRGTDIDAGDFAQYELIFATDVLNLEFKVGGLDNDDIIDVFGFNGTTPVYLQITDVNLGGNLNIIGNRVISTAGGANAPANSILISCANPINRIVINSGKQSGSIHQFNTNTLQIYEMQYCNLLDTDNDGVYNLNDLDSDNDGCPDVIEADHSDDDEDELLGVSPLTVNGSGLVTGQGGYTGFNVAVNDNTIIDIECSIYLPVELLEFNAVKEGNRSSLTWSIASQIDNDFFTIERTVNGIDWFTVEEIEGAGSSTIEMEYSLIDFNPQPGINYYRLSQTDFNGEKRVLDTKSLDFSGSQDIHLFPNPVNNSFTITEIKKGSSLQIYDVTGRLVKQILVEGTSTFASKDLANGTYRCVINQNGILTTIVFVKN